MDVSIIPVTGQDDEDTNFTFASAAAFPDVRHCGVLPGRPDVCDHMAGAATEAIKVEVVGDDVPRDGRLHSYCTCTSELTERESGLRDPSRNIPRVALVRHIDDQRVCPPILPS